MEKILTVLNHLIEQLDEIQASLSVVDEMKSLKEVHIFSNQ